SQAEARAKMLLLVLTLALGILGSSPAVAGTPDPCPAEPTSTPPTERLSAFARAIHGAAPVDILAIGSASTAEGDAVYPRVMLETLKAALPHAVLRLDVRGHRGLTAAEMQGLLTQALAEHRYALVLWQTGTVDAVRGLRPEELADALEKGAAEVIASGADLVLIDPQFSHFLTANVDLTPYELVMEHAASLPGVVLFPRYALMRDWATGGELDIEAAPTAKHPALSARVQACVGRALADFLLAGTGSQLIGQ
ncbi:MAG TPA: hypothetical protein VJ779_17105, partial [Acetobacteraceae bacterium]|nr:hypothetical protein [Acetobacteraceae bacterium]